MFDRLWHKGIIYKLQTVGITGSLLMWFINVFFRKGDQRVVLPIGSLRYTSITSGIPQGYKQCPLLFLKGDGNPDDYYVLYERSQ